MSERTYKKHVMRVVFPCVLYSASTGVMAGIFLFFFKLLAETLATVSVNIYVWVNANPAYIPLLFLGLIVLAVFTILILKVTPEASGGGIPRSVGMVRGLLTFRWLRAIVGAVFGSAIAFFAGLSVGSEGPGVQIGTSMGDAFNRIYHSRGHTWKRPVHTAGIAAGFAVVTGAPLSGVVFAIEEANSRYEPYLVLAAGIGVLFASATAGILAHLFNVDIRILNTGFLADLPITLIWIAVVVGISTGLVAVVYNTVIEKLTIVASRFRTPRLAAIYILSIFILTGIVGLIFPEVSGSGHGLIFGLVERRYVWYIIIVILIVKLGLIACTTASGAIGGTFLPMLSIGATVGALVAELLVACGLSHLYYGIIVMLSVCSFFGGAIYAPITATVFIIEATGSLISALHCIVAVFISMMIMYLFRVESVNEATLKMLLGKKHKGGVKAE